jgi:hypothetical protein
MCPPWFLCVALLAPFFSAGHRKVLCAPSGFRAVHRSLKAVPLLGVRCLHSVFCGVQLHRPLPLSVRRRGSRLVRSPVVGILDTEQQCVYLLLLLCVSFDWSKFASRIPWWCPALTSAACFDFSKLCCSVQQRLAFLISLMGVRLEQDENGSEKDEYRRYHICFRIFI